MITKTNAAILAVSVVVGVGSFITTRPTNGQPTPTAAPTTAPIDTRPRWGRMAAMGQWLGLTEEQRRKVNQADPSFWSEVTELRTSMAAERDALVKLFENPKATDQQINGQVDKVISIGNQLERRVVKHLLAVRGQLTPEQQQALLGLCARGVQQGMGWCGGPGGMGPGGGRFRGGWGAGQGQGQGPGRGWGQGQGGGRRWGRTTPGPQ
jgi:Spy/CpxP family protein refolding chaperone